ncbi:MAG TPA: GAF and ANTAR domain-containing protein [Streptosporangiaceae bacterium]|jgi:GAF domain-containing protein|nr:GAF and ANTAR domain-containing protein [Streptosporangiaceae bacterium]
MASGDLDRGDVAASITELQNLLLETSGVEEFLQELVVLAARTVAPRLSCGVTAQSGGAPLTVASSDAQATQVDEHQYQLDDGPCLHAMRTGEQVNIEDTAGPERWSGFSARAAANGIGSCLALPLTAEGIIGALNLYAPVAGAFGANEIRRAEMFAASVSAALALAARQASATVLSGQLRDALTSRAVIDQALGVIMAQERCTTAQAFVILRNASQNRNVKLRDIARQIVTGISGESPPPGPFGQ